MGKLPFHFTSHRTLAPQLPSRRALLLTASSVHDALFDEPNVNTNSTDDPTLAKPTVNGNHTVSDTMDSSLEPTVAPAVAPTEHVSSGIDGVAQFLPEIQQDSNSLFGDSDMGATVTNAVEAPTSDVRDEPATAEELSSATQARDVLDVGGGGDEMDGALRAVMSQTAVGTTRLAEARGDVRVQEVSNKGCVQVGCARLSGCNNNTTVGDAAHGW